MPHFEDMTIEELEQQEAHISQAIQDIDDEIVRLHEEMQALADEVNPVRLELENIRRERALLDPLTQHVKG